MSKLVFAADSHTPLTQNPNAGAARFGESALITEMPRYCRRGLQTLRLLRPFCFMRLARLLMRGHLVRIEDVQNQHLENETIGALEYHVSPVRGWVLRGQPEHHISRPAAMTAG